MTRDAQQGDPKLVLRGHARPKEAVEKGVTVRELVVQKGILTKEEVEEIFHIDRLT